jgi:hypothetical protein
MLSSSSYDVGNSSLLFLPDQTNSTTQIRPTPLNFTIFWLPQPIKKKLIKKKRINTKIEWKRRRKIQPSDEMSEKVVYEES